MSAESWVGSSTYSSRAGAAALPKATASSSVHLDQVRTQNLTRGAQRKGSCPLAGYHITHMYGQTAPGGLTCGSRQL